MTGFWTTQNIITIFLPSTLLPNMLHLSKVEISITLLITFSVLFFSYIGAGMLGQKIGRRLSFLILGPLIATLGSGLLYVLAHAEGWPLASIIALPRSSPWSWPILPSHRGCAAGLALPSTSGQCSAR